MTFAMKFDQPDPTFSIFNEFLKVSNEIAEKFLTISFHRRV